MRVTEFGSTSEVFVNQDEGMFVAFPITFDETVLTLETETVGGIKYVKAGSVVKEGTTVRGITAERYDITHGPVVGRVVLEGYALASKLTAAALAAASSLPRIIIMPYNYISVVLGDVDTTNHTAVIKIMNGAKFAATAAKTDFTVGAALTVASVDVLAGSEGIELTFAAAGKANLTAIAGTAFVGATGKVVGLPIELDV